MSCRETFRIPDTIRRALAPLPRGYLELLRTAVTTWRLDPRVRAVWLSGSAARQAADRASDLDLIVTVAAADQASFAADWPIWRDRITPTVLARQVGAGWIWTMVTPEWLRWDVVLESEEHLSEPVPVERLPIWDPWGLETALQVARPTAGPSAASALEMVVEWFRVSAMPEVILERDDWLLATEHVHYLRGLLYRLWVESRQPLGLSGIKRWSGKLDADQVTRLVALPTHADSRVSLEAAHRAISRLFVPSAASLLARLGVPWPEDLEAAARRHLELTAGWLDPYPRERLG